MLSRGFASSGYGSPIYLDRQSFGGGSLAKKQIIDFTGRGGDAKELIRVSGRFAFLKTGLIDELGITYRKETKKWTYLDIGANTGSITNYVKFELIPEKTIAADVITEEEFMKGQVKTMDAEVDDYIQIEDSVITLDDESVDLITCFQSIHHFSDQDAMLSEMNRVTKTGGYVFVRDHAVDPKNLDLIKLLNDVHSKWGDDPSGITYLSREKLEEMMQSHGFELVRRLDYDLSIPNKQAIYHSLFKKT